MDDIINLDESGGEHWIIARLGADRPVVRINIISTDEGIIVDVWRDDDTAAAPAASTYAFDDDLLADNEEN
jgi:hypothetical protein